MNARLEEVGGCGRTYRKSTSPMFNKIDDQELIEKKAQHRFLEVFQGWNVVEFPKQSEF